ESLREAWSNLDRMADKLAAAQARTGTKLLWGTANLFSHPRYMAGAATNPDPEVFAYAAGQVRQMLDVTHRLGGENYVLWGGREGYDT
ncbi:xylose isomerase, partial [Salmonella enterica]